MIKLKFILQREVMNFIVKGKEIFYTDRVFSNPLRCLPKDEQFIKKIIVSRNKYPFSLIKMFDLPEDELKEYEEAAPKGEDALATIIIRDCRNKGLVLIKREDISNE